VDRFTAHKELIANNQTVHAQAFYLSNVEEEDLVPTDTQKTNEIKYMLAAHWNEEEACAHDDFTASVAGITAGVATLLPETLSPASKVASDVVADTLSTPGSSVPLREHTLGHVDTDPPLVQVQVPELVPASDSAPGVEHLGHVNTDATQVPELVPASDSAPGDEHLGPVDTNPTPVPAPVPDLGPALVPAQVSSPEVQHTLVNSVKNVNNDGVSVDTKKTTKSERKAEKARQVLANALLLHGKTGLVGRLNPGKSAPYGSDTDDSECSELQPTQNCHDSPVMSPRIKAACDFIKRQHAVAQDAEVRYFTSS